MPPFAGHHTQALDFINQIVEIGICEVQPISPTPHFYGYIYNGDNREKVRVFPGPRNRPDLKIAELLKLESFQLEEAGLRLRVQITHEWKGEKVAWSGHALPMAEQSATDQSIVEHLLNKYALNTAQTELRSPADTFPPSSITITADEPEPEPRQQQITSRNQANQAQILAMACYEGKNPYELLTRSTARVEGKTDYHLMVYLRVVADELGVEVCDLVNEVMREAVKSGRVWDCQKGNGMP
tara:strand:- start:312 stop:1034 length:723 start_codon:yes stop_codon:yes gene_type:complete